MPGTLPPPVNERADEIWYSGGLLSDFLDSVAVYMQSGGSGGLSGSAAAGQVGYFSAASVVAGAPEFTWDNTAKVLTIAGGIHATDLQLTNPLPIAQGGTGAATQNGALNNLLPSQAGNNGMALLTDGTNTYWGAVSGGGGGTWGSITGTLSNQTDLATALSGKEPTIAGGTTGQYWRGDKTWHNLDINTLVPTQTGNSGKFLTTNGTAVAWGSAPTPTWGGITGTLSNQTDLQTALNAKQNSLPAQTGNSGKFLTTDGTNLSWGTAAGSATWGGIGGTLSNQTDLVAALGAKENSISSGTTSQYWRGDKTWQTLNAAAVGLGTTSNAQFLSLGLGNNLSGIYPATGNALTISQALDNAHIDPTNGTSIVRFSALLQNTTDGGTLYGFNCGVSTDVNNSSAGDFSGGLYGASFGVVHFAPVNLTGALLGMQIYATQASANDVGTVMGLSVSADIESSGAASKLVALALSSGSQGAVVTDNISLEIATGFGGSEVNNYAMYIHDQRGLGTSVNYALFSEGGDVTLKNSRVGINTTGVAGHSFEVMGTLATSQVADPTQGVDATLVNTPGNLYQADFQYYISLVDSLGGETTLSPVSQTVTITDEAVSGQIQLDNFPFVSHPSIVSFKIYRDDGGGTICIDVVPVTTQSYTDNNQGTGPNSGPSLYNTTSGLSVAGNTLLNKNLTVSKNVFLTDTTSSLNLGSTIQIYADSTYSSIFPSITLQPATTVGLVISPSGVSGDFDLNLMTLMETHGGSSTQRVIFDAYGNMVTGASTSFNTAAANIDIQSLHDTVGGVPVGYGLRTSQGVAVNFNDWLEFGIGNSTVTGAKFQVGVDNAQIFRTNVPNGTSSRLSVNAVDIMVNAAQSPMTITQIARSGSGAASLFSATAAAHTTMTTGNRWDVLFDMSATANIAGGNLALLESFIVKGRTYSFTSATTVTDLATVTIDKAPTMGTNGTATRSMAFWVKAGQSRFGGDVKMESKAMLGGDATISAGKYVDFAQTETDFTTSYPDSGGGSSVESSLLRNVYTVDPSANVASPHFINSANFTIKTAAANSKNIYDLEAISATMYHFGSGTITQGSAVTGTVYNLGTGVAAFLSGGNFLSFQNNAGGSTTWNNGVYALAGSYAGTITSNYGVYIEGGFGTLTNNYGLFVNSQTAGTNNWAIKTATGLVEFGDLVKMNTAMYWGTGTAAVNANYEIRRNNAATNNMQFNVPTSAAFDFTVNGTSVATLDATKLTLKKGLAYNTTTVSSTTYTILATDFYVGVTSTSSAVTLTLPALSSVAVGTTFVVKDESGAAGTNAITVARAGSDLIDGGTSFAVDTDYGSITIVARASGWYVI